MAETPTCPRKEDLAAWLDRRLAGEERDRIEAHLAACEPCRREVSDLSELLAEAAASTLAPSPGWMEEARSKVARRPRTARVAARRRASWPWVAAAAAVLVAALGFLLLRSGETPPEVVRTPPPRPEKPLPPTPRVSPEERPAPRPEEPPRPPAPVPSPVEKPPEKPLPPPPVPPKKPEEKAVVREEPEKRPEPVKPTVPERRPAHVPSALFAAFGTASTRLEGEAAWKTFKIGETRDFKGVLQVKTNGSRAKTRLGADTLYVSRSTDLALSPEENVTRLRLAAGEAFFSVDAQARKGDLFAVETPHATVTVRGTRFLVSVEAKETSVHVERGRVDFAAAGKTVTLNDGEASAAAEGKEPRSPEKAPIAAKIKWVQELEETLRIEAEILALKAPLRVVRDPAASGGGAIGVTGNPADDAEGAAEIRTRRKQPVPYAVWARVLFTRANDTGWTLHLADQAVPLRPPASPQWQWIRVGAFDLPDGEFRLRLAHRMSSARFDLIVLSSDPDFTPEK